MTKSKEPNDLVPDESKKKYTITIGVYEGHGVLDISFPEGRVAPSLYEIVGTLEVHKSIFIEKQLNKKKKK